MHQSDIDTVRRFNRTVTLRVGVLDDTYLARGRSLAHARILFEIDAGHTEVRALREHLDLDSGYLTRLLQALEREGLITIDEDGQDRRVRRATLTAQGRAERAEYERLSDEHARGILTALDDRQQKALVDAMATVDRLLTASMVEFAVVDPEHPAAREATRRYLAELDRRFRNGLITQGTISASDDEVRLPRGITLLATLHGEPAALGLLKFHEGGTTHLKRMWVNDRLRGLGLGRRLLATLESHAREHGIHTVQLETNFALDEAIALYRASGYVEVPPFNDEPNGDLWFEKPLV
ncbi:MAG TPA: MarR family winged helix-turn-helix transcriptional regulator [Pseudolysinimonas sp.]|nr:MarR family winged helix-turn-helix transcriptional regulator [Pseudolysinimonas sp.]